MAKSIFYQWNQIEEKLKDEGAPLESIGKIQSHILSILNLSEEKSYQSDFIKAMMVSEPGVEYQVLTTSAKKLLDNVVEILESGNEVLIDALKANIKAFFEASRAMKKDDENKSKEDD